MLSQNQTIHISKLLSYILRHKPEEYGIVLDENGYTNVDELINKLNAHKAIKVAIRRAKPIILKIKAGEMFLNGYKFYLSDNGVWLTEHVPVNFVVQ